MKVNEFPHPGERRLTKLKGSVIVCVEHLSPEGKRGGQIEFYFESEGPSLFHRRMSYRTWIGYQKISSGLHSASR